MSKDFLNDFKLYSAIFSGVALVICIAIGTVAATQFFEEFHIDFYSKAELSDYITLGIRKVVSHWIVFIAPLFFPLFLVPAIDLIRLITKSEVLKNLISGGKLYFLLYILAAVILLLNSKKLLGPLNVDDIKVGKLEIQKVWYGKNKNELKCVTFIGDTGAFSHYWSHTDKSVKTINTSVIQLIETMFNAEEQRYVDPLELNNKGNAQGVPKQKARYKPDSPVFDKWEKETALRKEMITKECRL